MLYVCSLHGKDAINVLGQIKSIGQSAIKYECGGNRWDLDVNNKIAYKLPETNQSSFQAANTKYSIFHINCGWSENILRWRYNVRSLFSGGQHS